MVPRAWYPHLIVLTFAGSNLVAFTLDTGAISVMDIETSQTFVRNFHFVAHSEPHWTSADCQLVALPAFGAQPVALGLPRCEHASLRFEGRPAVCPRVQLP
jgi:hypothetical protein